MKYILILFPLINKHQRHDNDQVEVCYQARNNEKNHDSKRYETQLS